MAHLSDKIDITHQSEMTEMPTFEPERVRSLRKPTGIAGLCRFALLLVLSGAGSCAATLEESRPDEPQKQLESKVEPPSEAPKNPEEASKDGAVFEAPAGIKEAILEAHNRLRALHCAPPLEWSDSIASVAQSWADQLNSEGCKFYHSKNGYGENLAMGTSSAYGMNSLVDMWYSEKSSYSYRSPGFSMSTGHFTQVVWKGSSQIGCGVTNCNGNTVLVCNYSPPGNYEGQFKENVLPETCSK